MWRPFRAQHFGVRVAKPPLWEGGGIVTARSVRCLLRLRDDYRPPSLPKRWLCHAHSKASRNVPRVAQGPNSVLPSVDISRDCCNRGAVSPEILSAAIRFAHTPPTG